MRRLLTLYLVLLVGAASCSSSGTDKATQAKQQPNSGTPSSFNQQQDFSLDLAVVGVREIGKTLQATCKPDENFRSFLQTADPAYIGFLTREEGKDEFILTSERWTPEMTEYVRPITIPNKQSLVGRRYCVRCAVKAKGTSGIPVEEFSSDQCDTIQSSEDPWSSKNPKLFSLTWGGISPAALAELDLIVTQLSEAESIRKAREFNPNLKAIASMGWQVADDGSFVKPVPEPWKLRTADGREICAAWSGSQCVWFVMNPSEFSGRYQNTGSPYHNLKYQEAIPRHVSLQDLSAFDGFGTDWWWWLPDWAGWWADLDLDTNSVPDSWEHQDYALCDRGSSLSCGEQWKRDKWQEGWLFALQGVRTVLGPDKFIYANNGSIDLAYTRDGSRNALEYLNGFIAETPFHGFADWEDRNQKPHFLQVMEDVARYGNMIGKSPLSLINTNPNREDQFRQGAGRNHLQAARQSVVLSLYEEGGMTNFEHEDDDWNEHFFYQTHYDEMRLNLGKRVCASKEIGAASRIYASFFEQGMSVFSANPYSVTVNDAQIRSAAGSCYGGPYYHFKGPQNLALNHGGAFTSVTLNSRYKNSSGRILPDAVILVKEPNKVVAADIVIDTETKYTAPLQDAATLVGEWTAHKGTGYNTGYRWPSHVSPYVKNRSAPSNSGRKAVFRPTIRLTGSYRLSVHNPAPDQHPSYPSPLSSATSWELRVNGTKIDGSDQRGPLNQANPAFQERWVPIASYTFPAGATVEFIILTDGAPANTTVTADAIRLEYGL